MAFSADLESKDGVAKITLTGELDASVSARFKETVGRAAAEHPRRLVLFLKDLSYMASAGIRVLVFAKQHLGPSVDIYMIGAPPAVLNTVRQTGVHHSFIVRDTYDPAGLEGS